MNTSPGRAPKAGISDNNVAGSGRSLSPAFIEFRCSIKKDGSDKPCRGLIPGPSVDVAVAYDFEVAPYQQVGYCPSCTSLLEITWSGLKEIPQIRKIHRQHKDDHCVKFVTAEEFFGFLEVAE